MNNLAGEKNRRVLVIDDNPAIHDDFRKILSPAAAAVPALDVTEEALFGYSAKVVQETRFEVESAYQGQEGVQLVKDAIAAGRPYAMAFVDVRMPPGWDGVETTRKIWELDPNLQVVLCTAYSDYSWGEMFEKLGLCDGLLILKKPFDAVEAFQLAHALTEKWWLHQQARRKMEELEGRVAARTQELARSLSLLNATLESTTDGIVAVDLSGKVISYNARFVGTWQFPADLLARRDAAEMRAHTAGQVKDSALFLQRLKELQTDPEAESFDVVELKDGRIFERYVFPQRIEKQCVGSVINWRDITARSRAEAMLQESKHFLRSTIDALSSHIAILDQDGTIIEVNAAWNHFASENNFIGKHRGVGDNYLQLCDSVSGGSSEEAPVVARGIRAVMAGQRAEFHLEYPCHSRRTQRWFIVRVTRFDGTGPVRVVMAHENITERKLAEEELQWKTAFLEAQVNSSGDGILVVNQEGKKILQNQRMVDVFQIPPAIANGKADADQVAWVTATTKNPEQFGEKVRYLYAHPDAISRDEIELKDGRTLDRYSSPVVGKDGRNYGRIWAFRDITERKRAELALRESNEKFHQLADNITDAFWIRSADMRELHYLSPAFAQIWGRSVESMHDHPQSWIDFILPADRERVLAAFATLTKGARSLDIEYCIVRPDGEIRWVRVRVFQVLNATGKLIRHTGIVTDITERKQAEARLARTEELYRRAIVGAGAVPYSSDYKSRSYVFMGEGIEQLIGYAAPEVTGQLWKQIILESVMAGETAGLSKDEAARRMASGEIWNWRCDMRVRTRDGKLRWLSDASVQHLDAAGRPIGAMGILQDITERKRNEIAALAFSKLGSRLSSVNSARETFDIIKEVSRELFGWDAFCIRLYSAPDDSIYSGFTIDTIAGQLVAQEHGEPKKPGELYRRIIARGGELIVREQPPAFGPDTVAFGDVGRPSAVLMFVPIRSRGHVVGILSVQSYTPNAYDEQDLKNLQTMADQCGGAIERIWTDEALRKTGAQLVQAQKLETVGKFAGGIAHEFNSIMTVIIGQSELLLTDLPAGNSWRDNATEIRKAADRAAILTRQLLAYGRRQMLTPEILDLNDVLTSLTGMIRHLLGGTVDVRAVAGRGIKSVKVDAGQMEQVIINIVMNAADAMPHGGKLTLETAPITLDQNYVSQYPDLKAGKYVMLAITDTGTGMSEAVKARVFEPFFTTKGVGKGTGLGLSTCYGIIKQSGGHIAVYSEPERGTTFKIYLPAVEAPPPGAARPLESVSLPHGTETILLVEDDPALRAMAATLLGRLGYTVLAAGNGVEALTLAQHPGTGRVDLLFTDMVMPQMSGKELADRLSASYSEIKILFTSAYTEEAISHQGVLNPGVELLVKPFTPSALAQKVRAMLDQPGATRANAAQKTFAFVKSAAATPPPGNTP